MGMGGITFKFITLSWCPIARKIKFRFAYLDKKSFIICALMTSSSLLGTSLKRPLTTFILENVAPNFFS